MYSFDFDVDAQRFLLRADDDGGRAPDDVGRAAESEHRSSLAKLFNLKHRAALTFRCRISEQSGFAQESLDFIMALEPYFYIAIMDDGNYDSEAIAARPPAENTVLKRLQLQSRLMFVQSHPHIQLHLGAAGDFDCEQTRGVSKYCVGRTTFETDRVPDGWCSCRHPSHAAYCLPDGRYLC
eukprot:SAG31_NODE_1779_length_7293_cov_39.850153_2_plen_181_part_00